MDKKTCKDHKELVHYVLKGIDKNNNVHANCGECGIAINTPLSKFNDPLSLLNQFSQDVCKKCDFITECWDSDLMVMPNPAAMRIVCKHRIGNCIDATSIVLKKIQ